MKAQELIDILSKIVEKHGNLDIVGGCMTDDRSPSTVSCIDSSGCETSEKPIGIFFE